MKTAFIVLISEKGNKEAELEEMVANKLRHLKHWKLENAPSSKVSLRLWFQ